MKKPSAASCRGSGSFAFLFADTANNAVNAGQGIMICLGKVFGVDTILVFLEDFLVAFLLTAGDATTTEFFVADSGSIMFYFWT